MSTFSPAYPVYDRQTVEPRDRVSAKSFFVGSSELPLDERLNQATHGVGFLLSLVAAAALLLAVPYVDGIRACGAIVYAIAITFLYLASTLSHSFLDRRRRTFWRVADQVAILGMAVGSFTPFALVHVATPFGWTLLAVTAIAAAALSIVRIIRWEAGVPIVAMVGVGLLPALAVAQMIRVGGLAGTLLLAVGTICYIGGLWFLMNDNKRLYYHALWHIATIVGSGCHFLFVYFWCILAPTA